MKHIYECKILLVDDNRELLSMVTRMLKREGFSQIKAVSCCREAKETLQEELPELIILDVMLPDGNGFSLFQEIRQKADIPILFLSARDEDNDRLLGLGLGADDYLTKPFLPKELSLRIGAIIRRTYLSGHEAQSRASDLTLGERTVHFDQGSVKGPLGETALTAKELLILKKLYENLNKIVTFDALCDVGRRLLHLRKYSDGAYPASPGKAGGGSLTSQMAFDRPGYRLSTERTPFLNHACPKTKNRKES